MEKILQAITGALLNFVKLWFEQEKAKADEWNAKASAAMLESVKSAEKMKIQIRSAEAQIPKTPAAWNAGRVILILITFMLLSGCIVRTVYVESKFPVIEKPKRPEINNTPGFSERESTLVGYAINLETRINMYNDLAHEHNKRNGYED